jgi:hypothetical protein
MISSWHVTPGCTGRRECGDPRGTNKTTRREAGESVLEVDDETGRPAEHKDAEWDLGAQQSGGARLKGLGVAVNRALPMVQSGSWQA